MQITPFETEKIEEATVGRFRQRSKAHTAMAYFLLLLVVLLLCLAVYIFFFAQTIESRGGSASVLDSIDKNINGKNKLSSALEGTRNAVLTGYNVGTRDIGDLIKAENDLKEVQSSINILKAQRQLLISINYVNQSDILGSQEEIEAKLGVLQQYAGVLKNLKKEAQQRYEQGISAIADVKEVESASISLQNEIDVAAIKKDQLPKAINYVQESGNFETIDLIRVNILRFGGISVTLFLIALIIPIYRYNIRLANFYMSRADALAICKELNYQNLPEMLEILTPKHAFEKEPVTPIDSLSGMASGLLGKK